MYTQSIQLVMAIAILAGSNQTDLLVQDLGDKSYETRNVAFKDLVTIGHAALPALRRGLKDRDYNVKVCCQILINKYFSQAENDVPSIWLLPKEVRMVGKADIAAGYYEKARLYINDWWDGIDEITKDDFRNDECSELAMKMFLRDMLEKEDCRNEVTLIKTDCRKSEQRLERYKEEGGYDYRWNYGYSNPPPAIEDIILETKKYIDLYRKPSE